MQNLKLKLNCILLIDDDKLTNFVNKIIVDGVGCVKYVIRKESAMSGLEYLSNSGCSHGTIPFPDLIFLDINMPFLDGWGFLNNYKDIKKKLPHLPVIVILSSFVDPNTILKASGFTELSGLYKKPMSTEICNAIIDEHFILGAGAKLSQ